MPDKKIVSIEDRIPKLKQKRRKRANRRLIFYLSIFFLLICIIIYLQSPLSHVKNFAVSGNEQLTVEEVIEASQLSTNTNIWTIDEDEVEQDILNHPFVQDVTVHKKLPWTIEITLTEHAKVGYVKLASDYHPILGDGSLLEPVSHIDGDAPLLIGFHDDELLQNMTHQLNQLPTAILDLISEIHWQPTETDQNKILLYMNDGYLVDGTIRNFAEKMQVYPSIVSQLDPALEGIIHIGVGVYFEQFNNDADDVEIENET